MRETLWSVVLAALGLALGSTAIDAANLFENKHTIGVPGCSVTLTIDNKGNVEHEVSNTEDCR